MYVSKNSDCTLDAIINKWVLFASGAAVVVYLMGFPEGFCFSERFSDVIARLRDVCRFISSIALFVFNYRCS